MWVGEMEQLLIFLLHAHKLQIHKDKGCDDTDDVSKQNTLLSHLSSLFPSWWCIYLCSYLFWHLPKELSMLMQFLWLLIAFDELDVGCHLFWWTPQPSEFRLMPLSGTKLFLLVLSRKALFDL